MSLAKKAGNVTGETVHALMNYVNTPEEDKDGASTIDFFNRDKKSNIYVIDNQWVQARFVTANKHLGQNATGRFFTTSTYKYTDTSIGGHIAFNTKPQFTRYADIRHPKRYSRYSDIPSIYETDGNGMGRYYSEAIDDNAQMVHMTFGVPEFNGLLNYLFCSIDYRDSVIANTGRRPEVYETFKTFGRVTGLVVLMACFPITTLLWIAGNAIYKLVSDQTTLDYYYMKPTMHNYWATVDTILNQIATELHVIKPYFDDKFDKESKEVGTNVNLDDDYNRSIADLLNGVYDAKTGYLSAFGIATKAQSKYLAYLKERSERLENGKNFIPIVDNNNRLLVDDYMVDGNKWSPIGTESDTMKLRSKTEGMNFQEWLNAVMKNIFTDPVPSTKKGLDEPNEAQEARKNEILNAAKADVKSSATSVLDGNLNTKSPDGKIPQFGPKDKDQDSYFNKIADTFKAIQSDAGSFVTFQVDYVGSVSESFSNRTGEIDTGGMIKSVTSKARNLKFDLAGGNLLTGSKINEALGYAKDAAMGLIDGFSLGLSSVVATLLGDAVVTMPKKWDDSDMSLASVTYNIKLRSPYGDPFSQLVNLYLPLSMLLAGTLPLQTGKHSYTSPYLCSLFCQGVQHIKLGMITNLQITRGTSKLGFNKAKRPMGIDVSFQVTDFAEQITAPINSSIFDTFSIQFHDDGTLGRYITTLAARDIHTNKYLKSKLGNRIDFFLKKWRYKWDPYRIGSWTGSTVYGVVSPFVPQGNFNVNTIQNYKL